MWAYVNGAYVRTEDAKLSVLDLGLMRGLGVFDYLRTYRGSPFHLEDHLLRLQYSANALGITPPDPPEKIAEIVMTLLKRNQLAESSIKIFVTGGINHDHFFPDGPASLVVLVYPLTPYPQALAEEGINVITTPSSRALPMAKTLHYAPAIVTLQKARHYSAKEALYVSAQGDLLEATTSNFFAFKGGTLHTCTSEEVLIGITSEVLLRLAADHFPIEKRSLRVQDIHAMQEAFITASNKEIIPVTSIDEKAIGQGLVGPRTKQLQNLFAAYTAQSSWPALHIPRYKTKLDTGP